MKKTTWFKLDSPRRQKQKVDGLVELFCEKDEIVMRRPFPTTTTISQMNKSANYLLSGTNSSTGAHPHQMKNDFRFRLFPTDQLYQQQLVSAKVKEVKNYKTSQIKWPFPADSHIVPDNDLINEHEQYSDPLTLGNYFSTGDQKYEKMKTKELVEIEKPSHHVRSVSHGADHVNSRQVPYSYRRSSDINHHGQDHQIKEYCTKPSCKGAGAGLLNFMSGNFSRAHELLDGRPAVVATAYAVNSTTTNSATPKTSNPTLLVPNNYSTQNSQSDQLVSNPNKANNSDQHSPKLAPSTAAKRSKQLIDNCCCCDNEALVPSFSVCSNDPNTTQDHCPCQSVEEPQLTPPPIDKAPRTPASKRKRPRTTAVHNLYERRRRDKINKKMRALQALIPNCNKVRKASILDEAIAYVKTLQLQLQMMPMGIVAMPPNPMMLGNGASSHLSATFALPSPTLHMLGFPPPQPAASFAPLSIGPSLTLVPPSISLSLSSSKNTNPAPIRHVH